MKTEIRNRRFFLFLLRVLIAAALAVGLVVGINVSVDGSGVITARSHDRMAVLLMQGETIAVPENYNARSLQMAVVNHTPALPETLVLGSSRGMFLGRDNTGYEDLYNACISGACLEDYYAVLELYRGKFSAWPARVILEVSPWIFNGNNPEDRWSEIYTYRTAAERLYTALNGKSPVILSPEGTPFAWEGRPFYSRENPYFSLPYFQYNCFIIRSKGLDALKGDPARVSEDPDESAKYPDGSIRYPASSENESPERLARVRAVSGPVVFEDSDKMDAIDEEKRLAFEHLVQELRNHGAEVILYLQPFSETQCRFSFDENLNPVFPAVEKYLRSFAAGCGARVVGSYDARKYGLTDDRFIDSLHLDRKGTETVWSADRP